MCVCGGVGVCVCARTLVRGRVYIYTHTHTYMGAHTHVCIHVCAYIQLIVSQFLYRICVHVCIFAIGLMSRVFANSPVDRGSIPGRVIPKTQKWYLMPPCLTARWGTRIKWSHSGNGVAPSPTPPCCSY